MQAALELGASRTKYPLADVLALAEVRAGRYEAACRLMQEACMVTIGLSREIDAVDQVYDALAGTTDRAAAVGALDRFRIVNSAAGSHQIMRRRLMSWHAQLAAYDQAYEVLNCSLDNFAATGTIGIAWGLLWSRERAGLREDARFTSLAERMRLPEYWERFGPPDGYDWRDGRLVSR